MPRSYPPQGMAQVIGSGSTSLGPHSLSVIVRAGHVISADLANQLAVPGPQPLRADRAIPGSVFVRSREISRPCRRRNRVFLRGQSLRNEATTRFRCYRNLLPFRDTFHGRTVIAHPLAREKRAGRVGQTPRDTAVRATGAGTGYRSFGRIETYMPAGASFKCRM
jgi:hypothetical protein